MKPFIVTSNEFYKQLQAAGAIDNDPNTVSRCIIDLKVGEPARFYVECFADRETLKAGIDAGLSITTQEDQT